MPSQPKIFRPGVRKRKAYATALRVFWSYTWLALKSKLLGRRYYERHINTLHRKNADRIKRRVQELQGLFIKIGQLISNLSNILPEEFRAPLEALQDHADPKPYAEIAQTITQQLGQSPQIIFSSFSEEPLASASIGQVHRAELDGQQVVVKVQHLHIDTIARADLEILQNLVRLHAYFMDMQGLDHTYEQVREMIEAELDYTQEAASMQQIAENLKEVPELRVRIPEVYRAYSTKKVLVSAYQKGVNIGRVNALADWDLDLTDVAKRLIELYCKMVLVDGFYHADPHPGNLLVNQAGDIILLDFGAVAYLNDATKKAIPELIEAVIRNDTEATVQALRQMGFIGPDDASRKYVQKLVEIFREFIQTEVELDGLNFQNVKLNSGLSSFATLLKKIDLREVSNNIQIPKDYILLNRTLVLLIGNAFQLAPSLNTLQVVRPYMKKHMLEQDGGLFDLIINTFKNQVSTAISLPQELSRFLKKADRSELEEELKTANQQLRKIYFLGQQMFYTALLLLLVYSLTNLSFAQVAFAKSVHWVAMGIMGLLLLRAILRDRQ